VTQGDDDTEVVDEIETGAEKLTSRPLRPESRCVAPSEGVDSENSGDEEAEESDDLVCGKGGAANYLHDAVGKDPAGEAADGEKNGRKV